ncbi:flagellar assembly protein FliH, partial [Methylobacterium sp. WL93]
MNAKPAPAKTPFLFETDFRRPQPSRESVRAAEAADEAAAHAHARG